VLEDLIKFGEYERHETFPRLLNDPIKNIYLDVYKSADAGLESLPRHPRLFIGLSLRKTGFSLRVAHLGFVVETVSLGQAFLRILTFHAIIHPVLYSFRYHSC
jgi:hypothetical protein